MEYILDLDAALADGYTLPMHGVYRGESCRIVKHDSGTSVWIEFTDNDLYMGQCFNVSKTHLKPKRVMSNAYTFLALYSDASKECITVIATEVDSAWILAANSVSRAKLKQLILENWEII